jgi:hypothetical protein
MTTNTRFAQLCKNIQKHLESDRAVAIDMITHKPIMAPRGTSRRVAMLRSIPRVKIAPHANRHTDPATAAEAADAGGDEGGDPDPDPERAQTNPAVKGGV